MLKGFFLLLIMSIPSLSFSKASSSDFCDVLISGPINVTLKNSRHASVQIKGDKRDVVGVHHWITNKKLTVKVGEGYPHFGELNVTISAPYLTNFEYHGRGTISGKGISSTHLEMLIDNKGKTFLSGHLALRKFTMSGESYAEITGVKTKRLAISLENKAHLQLQGKVAVSLIDICDEAWLGLFWVNSRNLIIREHGNAYMQLAGIVNKLNLESWDTAHFNGRYLRARRAFVKTHGNALAEITALDHQHTLATDSSNIEFFELPNTRADFMAFNGAVLDVRDLSPALTKDYTPYNK